MPSDKRTGDGLEEYRRKRDFSETAEPSGEGDRGRPPAPRPALPPDLPEGVETGSFVVQQHGARRLHWDFRLEVGGVLKSWAVPRGPSTNPAEKRLAVPTEDHPLDYQHYEGVIPRGNYGAGPSLIWDRGTYVNISHDRRGRPVPMDKALAKGHVSVWLAGEKLAGGWSLTRIEGDSTAGKQAWLLVKRADPAADAERDIVEDSPRSVVSGRTLEELFAEEG
ncbi:MAG TPA: DNA polymerase ligase N-terminal domain-containing protein [Acidimicrobiales bacterium]|nr:DNA polymerase ligase N-terminal domain-containing protein [Acidimicrobiales bacterium]